MQSTDNIVEIFYTFPYIMIHVQEHAHVSLCMGKLMYINNIILIKLS